jgi:phenylpropionate dioxygenase-like ring-hydroxylating dioxygenase large terminal subunit
MLEFERNKLTIRMQQALTRRHGDLAISARDSFLCTPQQLSQVQPRLTPIVAIGDFPDPERVKVHTDPSLLLARLPMSERKPFFNRCPHRGARLKTAARGGHAVCSYHRWSFAADGQLIAAYGKHHGICGDIRLEEMMTHEVGGFMWKNKSAGHSTLSGIHTMSQFHGWSDPKTVSEFSLHGKFNWQIGVEAFLETYHFASVHLDTLGTLQVKNISLFDAADDFVRLIVPWRLPLHPSEDILKYCHFMYFIYPRHFFLVFEKHFGWLSVNPGGDDESTIIYRGMSFDSSPDGETIHLINRSVQSMEKLHREDIEVCEGVQANDLPQFPNIITRYEPAIQWFREQLQRDIHHNRLDTHQMQFTTFLTKNM